MLLVQPAAGGESRFGILPYKQTGEKEVNPA